MKPPVEVRSLGYLLIVMLVTRVGTDQIPKHVPFLEIMDIGPAYRWGLALMYLFFASAAAAFIGPLFRLGCLAAGGSLILKVIVNMPSYSNGRLFDGLLLVLCGLCFSSRGVSLLRAQCILVYAGAGLAKSIDPDWWNGRFMAATFAFHPSASWVPYWFAQPAGIASIVTESSIALLLLFPATRNWAVLLVAGFHTGILVMLSEDFTTFYYSVAMASTLLFLRLPEIERIETPFAWLTGYSVFSAVRDARYRPGKAAVHFTKGSVTGLPALLFQALSSLPLLMIVLAINGTIARQGFLRARDAIVCTCVLAAFYVSFHIWRATREHSS